MRRRPVRADRLVREYRDWRGMIVEELERLARSLGVPPREAEEVIADFIAYRVSEWEARRRLLRSARQRGRRASGP